MTHSQVMEKQLQAMTEAMQSTMKSNMDVYASFQTEFRRMIELNATAMAKLTPGLLETIKEESDRLLKNIKDAAAAMK